MLIICAWGDMDASGVQKHQKLFLTVVGAGSCKKRADENAFSHTSVATLRRAGLHGSTACEFYSAVMCPSLPRILLALLGSRVEDLDAAIGPRRESKIMS